MAIMSASQTAAELQRKKNLGVAPTSSANLPQFNKLTPMPAAKTPTTGVVPAMPKATTQQTPMMTTNQGFVPMESNQNTTPSPATPKPSTGYAPPALGSNVAGFDPNNANHSAIAAAGQLWATAKASGDTAGMAAAAAQGTALRSQSGTPAMFDSRAGVTSFGMPEIRKTSGEETGVVPTTPNAYESPVNLYPQLTPEQIAEEQRAKAAALIQQRTTAANQAKAGINTSFDRLKTNIGQDRALENTFNDRQLSPFSGRSDFAQGMIAMERGRSDREAQQDLQTRLANIDVSLQDFENATEDQRQAMINEAIRQERSYGLQVDNQQYGQWSDQRNFAADQTQQQWQNRFNYGNAIGNFGNGQQTTQQQQLTYNQARDQISDAQWKTEFDEDVRQFGIDDAWRKYQEKQVAGRAASGGGSSGGSSGGPSSESSIVDINQPRTTETMINHIIKQLPGGKYVAGPPDPNQSEDIENMILSNPNLSEKQIIELYKKFGIPLPQ